MSIIKADIEENCWPDRRILNVKLIFDTDNIEHDLAGIRRIIDSFTEFKNQIVSIKEVDKNGKAKVWKGIMLHSQELSMALKDKRFGCEPLIVSSSSSSDLDSDITYNSQLSEIFDTEYKNFLRNLPEPTVNEP